MIFRDCDIKAKWYEEATEEREERVYYCQNWRADVSAILTDTGSMIEWVKYSTYRVPFSLPAGDTDSNGTYDALGRLTLVWTGTKTIAQYRYNGLNHRIAWRYDTNNTGEAENGNPLWGECGMEGVGEGCTGELLWLRQTLAGCRHIPSRRQISHEVFVIYTTAKSKGCEV